MNIAANIASIYNEISENVRLVAVSKTKPVEDILTAYHSGHKIFGENKVQELVQKFEVLPKDIEWHFIGHLQTNKVKYLVPFVALIHGIDSLKLLKAVNKEAKKNNCVVSCLLQFHIAEESTKFGFSLQEVKEMLQTDEYKALANVEICGVMGMATYTENNEQIRNEFKNLAEIFRTLKNEYFSASEKFSEISMGMSDDYRIALEEGSTIIRVGSKIFGERNYKKQ